MRIWLFIGLGVVLSSAMWAVLGMFVAGTLATREADLSRLSPEDRLRVELEMVDRLNREVLGQEAGIPVAELTEEQRLVMDSLEAQGFEVPDEETLGLVAREQKAEATKVSPPPPGYERPSEPTQVSPVLAAMGCGSVIVMFGLIGAAFLFRPGASD